MRSAVQTTNTATKGRPCKLLSALLCSHCFLIPIYEAWPGTVLEPFFEDDGISLLSILLTKQMTGSSLGYNCNG